MSRQAPSHIATIVGTNLRSARKAKGLTQPDVAGALGIESFQVSRWERGVHRPSDPAMQALAELLGCEVAWFFTEQKAAA